MWVLMLAACTETLRSDPRPAMRTRFVQGRSVRLTPAAALREERNFEACVGYKQVARADLGEDGWQGLLLVAARDPSCLPVEDGSELAAWARQREGWGDSVGEWDAAHGLPVAPEGLSPGSRLRVLLRGADQGAVVRAALDVLKGDPEEPFACAVVVRDALERGELRNAASLCEGVTTSSVVRLRAQALDEAGRVQEAVAAYDRAGLAVHAAAVLYQDAPERDGEALQRLDEPIPPVAIHRGWRAVLRHEPIDLSGLDGGMEATMLRSLAGVQAAIAALPALPGLEPLVLHARLTGDLSRLDREVLAAPNSDVLLRASLGIRLERGIHPADALRWIAAADPDHVRLGGVVSRREAPWTAIAPWTWSDLAARVALPPLAGADEIGAEWRRAADLSFGDREVALAALQASYPVLRGLARMRAGGSFLDDPPGCR